MGRTPSLKGITWWLISRVSKEKMAYGVPAYLLMLLFSVLDVEKEVGSVFLQYCSSIAPLCPDLTSWFPRFALDALEKQVHSPVTFVGIKVENKPGHPTPFSNRLHILAIDQYLEATVSDCADEQGHRGRHSCTATNFWCLGWLGRKISLEWMAPVCNRQRSWCVWVVLCDAPPYERPAIHGMYIIRGRMGLG